ncbi:hypothetical protein [Kitasatospora arboriphila]|uniref:Uncharacterized protein n=1 Tax=Kitasatospora arboriphila TaxID=258052 RepID=A0ABN1TGE4_9ACTN
MDDRDTTAHLEWWADPETCPGRVAVRLGAVSTAGGAWRCEALLAPPLSAADREGLDFLMAVHPVFTLRRGAGTVEVRADRAGTDDGLVLTAVPAPAP